MVSNIKIGQKQQQQQQQQQYFCILNFLLSHKEAREV